MKKWMMMVACLAVAGISFAGNAPASEAEKAEIALNHQIRVFQESFPCQAKEDREYHKCVRKELSFMRQNYYKLRTGNRQAASRLGSIIYSISWKDVSGTPDWVTHYITKYKDQLVLTEKPDIGLYSENFFKRTAKWAEFAQHLTCDNNPYSQGC